MSNPRSILQTVVFRRSIDENTCAVIRCRKTEEIQTAYDLKQALKRAATAWARTAEGGAVILANNGDFNVGDVALHEKELRPFLDEAGVQQFHIECFVDVFPDYSWDYDDRLVEE